MTLRSGATRVETIEHILADLWRDMHDISFYDWDVLNTPGVELLCHILTVFKNRSRQVPNTHLH